MAQTKTVPKKKRTSTMVLANRTKKPKLSPMLKKLGYTPGSDNCKRYQVLGEFLTGTRNLNWISLTTIPQTANNGINLRQRDLINVKGFEINYDYGNTDATLYFNVAVCVAIGPFDEADPIQEFFRGNGTVRAVNFNTGLAAIELATHKINADKFITLKHDRHLLSASTPQANGNQTNLGRQSYYIPFDRQLRYDDNDRPAAYPVYLFWWCDNFQANAGTPPVPGALNVSFKTVTYFKETI